MNIQIPAYGEGFWVTMAFFIMFTVLCAAAIAFNSGPATQIVTGLSSGVTAILAFWFATRGQTAAADK